MAATLLEELTAGHIPRLVPLTVEQLHEMARAGIVPDGSPIELIDGVLVYKDRAAAGAETTGHDPRHALIVTRLVELFMEWAKRIGCHVRVQLPVTLTEMNEPEPDLALVEGPISNYAERHPGPGQIAAVFEVAGSSLRFDRTTKQRLYASAGIPIYWIVNLAENRVEVYTQPQPARGQYGALRSYQPGESASMVVAAHSLEVEVAALLA